MVLNTSGRLYSPCQKADGVAVRGRLIPGTHRPGVEIFRLKRGLLKDQSQARLDRFARTGRENVYLTTLDPRFAQFDLLAFAGDEVLCLRIFISITETDAPLRVGPLRSEACQSPLGTMAPVA